MKIQHYRRFQITFIPADQVDFAKEIGFVESQLSGVKMELDTGSNPRNIDGYRGKFDKDLAALRRSGAVVTGELTAEAAAALARGKVIDNRPESHQTPIVDPPGTKEKGKEAPKAKA